MLPFLDSKKLGAAISERRTSDGNKTYEDEKPSDLEARAQELMAAIESKDAAAITSALLACMAEVK